MMCLEKFNKKMALNGGSLRNEHVENSKELLQYTFFDDASLALGVYFWELGLKNYEDETQISIRLFDRKYSAANGVTVAFQTLYDTPVTVGDIVYDSLSSEYLICTESLNINNIHWQGRFTLCNWVLKWQDKKGNILEYPCYDINSTQYNSGEQFNKQITIGSSQHIIILPCDENTVVLKTPQRFFLDKDTEHPTSFIVTQNDTTSYGFGKKGIVRVTVVEHPHNPVADRFDLGVCDYIDVDDVATDNSGDDFVSKSVISYTSNVIKSGGSPQTFIGSFFDLSGEEVPGVGCNWNIVCDFFDVLKVVETDNRISISIDDDDYVDEEFKIVLSDADGNYTSSQIVRVESLL